MLFKNRVCNNISIMYIVLTGLLGWDERKHLCEFCGLFVFGGVDQSKVVFETVVTAPNPLYQLPSVLTDTASFFPKGIVINLTIASLRFPLCLAPCWLSLSLQTTLNAQFICHTMEVPLLSWIPLQNPFVKISFLSVICVNLNTVPVIVFKCGCHVSPKRRQLAFPAPISRVLLYQIWPSMFLPLWQSLIWLSCQVKKYVTRI